MLTPRENFLETIRGGKPDRFVKQFEFFPMPYSDPWNATNPFPWEPGAPDCVDFWGVTWTWPEGTPGAFPRHGDGFTVLEDVEEWKGRVKCPPLEYSDELWEAAKKDYASYDRSKAQRRRQRRFWRDMGHPGLRWRDSPP